MPHTHSAEKRMRQGASRRLRNRGIKSSLKTVLQAARAATGAAAKDLIRDAIRQIDKAAAKGVLHRNTASRRKSALMRLGAAQKP
jgi:small subunit ribosomal protein S20